jgi:murein DD-endopeptidase MepM/ murein hydrolase activator NlpD
MAAARAQGTASLDQARSHGANRSSQIEATELGNEPPLSVDGGTGGFVDRRRISVQWFTGTILTALSGTALMGGAVFTSLDGETNFAALPERVELALRGALGVAGERLGTARKGDRLPQAEDATVARQVIPVTQNARVGNHEVVRVRSYVRVAGNLSLAVSDVSSSIPAFNPQRMLTEGTSDEDVATAAAAAAEPEASVAFVMRDLPPLLGKVRIATTTPPDEVQSRVREAADWMEKTARHIPVAANIGGVKLAYAAEGNPSDPYAGFEARIVPENVTLLPKTTNETTGGNAWSERTVAVKRGDTLASLLREFGATPDEITKIAAVLGPRAGVQAVKEGQKLRILLAPSVNGTRLQPIRVIIATDNVVDAVVALSDTGKFVAVDVKSVDSEIADNSDKAAEDDGSGARLYRSIYETARRDQIPEPIIDDIIKIYSYDVDFQRKVQPGDSFEVLFAGDEENAETRNDVLFTSLTVGGETKRFYRFQSPDDGVVDYYDEAGKSAKKFLLRKPVGDAIMRSGFGLRRHPILGYTKMHTGVDWATATGTPIFAAGNGVVEKVGWESGYGKFVLLRHNNGYETAYGHMTAFARNLEEGTKVRQGQVIGFVGSTGLSTGAHVHFEIRINGRFVDPMRVKLPRGRELQGTMLASFERERARIDTIMTRPAMRTAQNTQPAGR